MNNATKLGTEKISKLLMAFALPSVVSMVLNALYNMVDQIFIGQGVGYLGNAATNVIFPLAMLAVAFGLMLGDGSASYFNLKHGEGKHEEADRGMAAGILGLVIIGLILALVYNVFLGPLCRLFGATDATYSYCIQYGRIISIGIFFCVFSSATMSMIRADGSPKFAMTGMIVGCAINMIFDPVTIFVWKWGVTGAALATIAGQIANSFINLWYLCGHTKTMKLSKESFHHCASKITQVARFGMSSFTTQVMIVVVVLIQNNLLVYYGALSVYGADVPMAAFGVTMKIFNILQSAVTGMMAGAQPILSFNYGSDRYDRVLKTLKITLCAALILTISATIWFQLAPMSVISIFGSNDALYNQYAMLCLRVYLSMLAMDAIQMVTSSFLQSLGKPKEASILILIRQLVVLVPGMLIFGYFFGVEGLLYAGPVAGVVAGVLSIYDLKRETKKLKAA